MDITPDLRVAATAAAIARGNELIDGMGGATDNSDITLPNPAGLKPQPIEATIDVTAGATADLAADIGD